MRRIPSSGFSFAPLIALIPGGVALAAFALDGALDDSDVLACIVLLGLGAIWAGRRNNHVLPEPEGQPQQAMDPAILDALPGPVLLLDERRRVLAANRAADELLGVGIHGRDICLILRQPEAQQAIRRTVTGEIPGTGVDLMFESPMRRYYQLQVVGLSGEDVQPVNAVVALHELTALKEAEAMRADFVANVSHELRSPLAALAGFIETLQTTAENDEEARARFLGIMEGEAQRMSRMTDDLLSLSKIQVNEHIRPTESVSLAAVLAGVSEAATIKASKKGMSIDLALPDDLPEVAGNQDELCEVFENLIDNAVKYGADDTAVTITGRTIPVLPETGERGVEITVEDQGEGIEAEHLPRLTERFYRVDKGRSRAMGGTGLGLAIVKHILNRHRGRLQATSETGKGSRFSVQVPIFEG